MSGDEIYVADLQSKRVALAIAGKLGLRERTLTINLLPMTLVKVADAVPFLLTEIQRNDLIPEQIIVEFTEREVISRMDEFTDAVRKLKGAEFASLSITLAPVCRAIAAGAISTGSN